MIKNIFFDFNGTILDDIDLCLELLNNILKEQNKNILTVEEYKEVFGFPVKDYYLKAGVDFNIKSYADLADEFIKEYQPKSFNCKLVQNVIDVVKVLSSKGINCYILSASEINNLLEQCDVLKITKYFKGIIGIDNIHAASKIETGKSYIIANNIDCSSSVMIGDTTHDYEVAKALGLKPILYTGGHQSKNVLSKVGAKMIDSMTELLELIGESND